MTSVVEYSRESERTSTGLAATQESENHQTSGISGDQQSGKDFLKRILVIACLGYVPTIAFTIIIYFVEGPHEDSEMRKYEEAKISALEEPLKVDFDSMNETERQVWMNNWFETALELGRNDPGEKKWTMMRSFGFTFQTATTIGFGALAPKTDAGKIMTIVFGCVIIPLVLYMELLLGLGKQDGIRIYYNTG